MSAIAYMRSTSSPFRKPVKCTCRASPSFAARSIITESMSPLPLITNFTRGSIRTTRAAASRK